MSDKEIEQELQNALKPGHKRVPKLLISVVGIIGLLVGYFGVLQLNKQPNPASSPTASPTPTPTPLLKRVSFSEPLPITWTGWNEAKVGLVSAELQGVSFADIPGMDDEIELKGKKFLLVLNLKIKVQGGFCSSSLASSMRLVLENEEFAAPQYTSEDCGPPLTTLNDQKVAFAVEPKAPEYLFRINELYRSSRGSQFYFRVTQTETELAAIAEAHYINSCKARPQEFSGACFETRGRMATYDGNPSLRIWPVGTKRLLGLSERRGSMNEAYNLPRELLAQLSFGKAMYADFTICPFTDDEPGVMRLACVESAENISIRDWP